MEISFTLREIKAAEDDFDQQIETLMSKVYIGDGYADPSLIQTVFRAKEIKKRGVQIAALDTDNRVIGFVVCANSANPYNQIADNTEAEMQLLAVDPEWRGLGIAEKLIDSFEQKALELGYSNAVLSTQTSMTTAHRIYHRVGYERCAPRDWTRNKRDFLAFTKILKKGASS